ncbi:MAG: MFS transporter [Solirubrobacteraceae bacterium]
MLHSHEGLDRAGGVARVGVLVPLRDRNFRLLSMATSVSLLGDGAFLVALVWQVYAISNTPTAMSFAGIAMTVPTIVLLLVGGVASDRLPRRDLMVAADCLRAVALAAMTVLSLLGALELWHVIMLVAVYGSGTAFFAPASDALVPELLSGSSLAQANALDQLLRPLLLRMAGPAVGGVLVALWGAGAVFGLDAASFVVSAVLLMSIRVPARRAAAAGESLVRDLRAGWRVVRGHVWLWATFASAAIAYLLFMGPVEVLLPYVVKTDLGGGPAALGLVFGAGGIGSAATAVAMAQQRLPRREITFMYVTWTLATVAVAGYGLGSAIWQLMLVSLVFNACETAGTIVWATMKQRQVPAAFLGRVSSLDWLISIGLLPLSFALTGPAAGAIGARATLVVGGVIGALVTLGALCLPGMRQVEGRPARTPEAAAA